MLLFAALCGFVLLLAGAYIAGYERGHSEGITEEARRWCRMTVPERAARSRAVQAAERIKGSWKELTH